MRMCGFSSHWILFRIPSLPEHSTIPDEPVGNKKVQIKTWTRKPNGVFSKWSRPFTEFGEFREPEGSLKHELGTVRIYSVSRVSVVCLLCFLNRRSWVPIPQSSFLIFNFFVTEFSDFSENIQRKLHWAWFVNGIACNTSWKAVFVLNIPKVKYWVYTFGWLLVNFQRNLTNEIS